MTSSTSRRRLPRAYARPQGTPQRADKVIAGLLIGYLAYSLALWPLVPALIGSHPLVLEIIGGSTLAEVTMGAHSRLGNLPVWVAVIAGVPSMMMFDWVFWWAGRRWGDRALHLIMGRAASPRARARREARLKRLERTAARFGPVAIVLAYYLPIPNVLIYVAAGLAEMRLRTFLILDLLGALAWVGPAVGLGYAIGQPAIDVLNGINHYSTILTLAVIALMVGLQVRDRRSVSP